MSITEAMITKIVLGLSDQLYNEQKNTLASRYIVKDNELAKVPGMPSLVWSDILPFHPLFIASVKLDYMIDNEKKLQYESIRDIRVSVEFKSEKPTKL